MTDRSIVALVEVRELDGGSIRFTVRLRTSLGFVYMRGFRLGADGRLMTPTIPLGGAMRFSLVNLPKAMTAAVRNKVLKLRRSESGQ